MSNELHSQFQESNRPPASSEVRAWILAAIVVASQTVAVVWWAATLSAELRSVRETLQYLQNHVKTQSDDHEQRIRALERKP